MEEISKACQISAASLKYIKDYLQPGITTEDLANILNDYFISQGSISGCYGYHNFPGYCCISINEEVCHGIPSKRQIQSNDLVKIDVAVIKNGYYGDCARTYSIGNKHDKLISKMRSIYDKILKVVKPGNTIGDIGWEIYNNRHPFSVVKEFGGHGVGKEFHMKPFVPNYGQKGQGEKLKEGMIFTIEPMFNVGKNGIFIANDGWTIITTDRSLSLQHEETILVTKNGCEILTQ